MRGLAWDPEGAYLAAAQADGTLLIWDTSSGKQEARKRELRKVKGGMMHDSVTGGSTSCASRWSCLGLLVPGP